MSVRLSIEEKELLSWLIEKKNKTSDTVLYNEEDTKELLISFGENFINILRELCLKGAIEVKREVSLSNSLYITVNVAYIEKYEEEKQLAQPQINITNNAPNTQTSVNTGNGNITLVNENKVEEKTQESKDNKLVWQIIIPIIVTIIGGVVLYYLGM